MTATTNTDNNKFPPQIKYIVGNEACERYSYYGMRSILTVFMIQVLLFQEAKATSVYHLFAGACYLTPLLGAWISDRIWGKYKTILYLSLIYCVGHAVLAIWETEYGLYVGLGLIALGSGGIKPCVSAHVGDQFKANQQHLLKKIYELFYFMINFGSFFSTLITPWTLDKFGPSVAFGIPGILMFIATFIFWLGRKQFVHVPPT
ncbi:MAG: oligopeptide:H+ symporter, partial [Candidatus Caldatribacteriota bacterium]